MTPVGQELLKDELLFRRRWRQLSSLFLRRGSLGLLDQALVSGARFFCTVMIGRACGQHELGIYTLGFSIIVMITSVKYSVISLPYTVFARRLTSDRRAPYAGSTLSHLFLLSVVSMLGLALAGALFGSRWLQLSSLTQLAPVMWTLMAVMPMVLLWEYSRRMAFAHLDVGLAVRLDAIVTAITVVGILVVNAFGYLNALTGFAVMGVGCAVATIPWLVATRSAFSVSRSAVRQHWSDNWTFGRWVFAGQISWSMMSAVVPWFLAIAYGEASAGDFAACMTLALLANPFMIGIGNVLLPSVANAYAEGGAAKVREISRQSTIWLGWAMALFCVGVAIFGGWFVSLLYGPNFRGLEASIFVLAVAALVQTLAVGPDIGMQVFTRTDLNFRANLAGLVVTCVATPPLLMRWTVLGGALGWLLGNTAATATRWICFLGMDDQDLRL